ncbi:unnamed protein product [Rhizoctonia solani]|uniref:Uncharacterized protein n=1 Tax=Rhizoctonia solani TaxID=456999 RepID=A0A8H2Y174_9AGAM|nr:unnamed protein product [Rhizoctonia solani]
MSGYPSHQVISPPGLSPYLVGEYKLESITGVPNDDEVIRIHAVLRVANKLVDVQGMSDPSLLSHISEHLFDVQMAKYIQRCAQTGPSPHESVAVSRSTERTNEVTDAQINNLGTGSNHAESYGSVQTTSDITIHDAIARSIQLAERSNQLIERSNQIVDRLTEVVERCSQPAERSNDPAEKFSELVGRLNEHLERSNHIAEASTKLVENLGGVLRNINRVLVRIQHAIVRSHRGNTLCAIDCLTNEKGEASTRDNWTSFSWLSKTYPNNSTKVSVIINGGTQFGHVYGEAVAHFLRFHGIGNEYFKDGSSLTLVAEKEGDARARLGSYLTSCLG